METELVKFLDKQSNIKNIDRSHVLSSVKLLPSQIKETWQGVSQLSLNVPHPVSSVYFCGMGGSAYAGRIIKSLYRDFIKIPVEVIDDYSLPQSVGKQSLVVAASYSGDTEETLSCCRQAINKKLTVIGVASGGRLVRLLKNHQLTVYHFNPVSNPSKQPRLGQGYLISAQLGFLAKLNLIGITRTDIVKLIDFLEKGNDRLNEKVISSQNMAKKLAVKSHDKIISLVGAEFLTGVLHAVRNPLNETGKHFADYFVLPELNHHLLEGLQYPEFLSHSVIFIFIDSPFYSSPIKKKVKITKEVLTKIGLKHLTVNLKGSTPLEQVFELVQLFSYFSFYLAIIHRTDPASVPWVDYFKRKLKKGG